MIHRRAICGVALAALLCAGCSGGQPVQPFATNEGSPASIGSPGLEAGAGASTYRVLYSFGSSNTDAAWPEGSVIDVNGTFYGAAWGGSNCSYTGGTGGCGSVFTITAAGVERVLYDFGGAGDGVRPGPGASLLDVNGTLYGTTLEGGPSNEGIIYSLSLSGDEKILHAFTSSNLAPRLPTAALIDVKGILYGTTWAGGRYHNSNQSDYDFGGTAYRIDPRTRGFHVLHDFGNGTDGQTLMCTLLNVNGTLYGVTTEGGSYSGNGTVFSLTRSGTERVLHSFGQGHDGTYPYDTSGLIDLNGTLYGTTEYGGTHKRGTVFAISPTGTERVLYSFGASGDGFYPEAGLIDVNGTLYGTTTSGGAYYSRGNPRKYGGTLYSISLSGKERILHSFGNGTDGQNPQGAPLDVNGTLYGTTTWGGKNLCVHGTGRPNCGTIYTFTLPH